MRQRSSLLCRVLFLAGPRLICGALVFLPLTPAFAARSPRLVTYSSECSCENDHGVARWRAKTDRAEPPSDPRNIEAITPSEIYAWRGPGMIPRGGARTGNEVHWYALTGRLIALQTESDGDLHLVLENASDKQPGQVIVEIPLGARWCELRTKVFSWTDAAFPFISGGSQATQLKQQPVITVIGKAFYDTDHSGKELRNNRRPRAKDKAVWEIHPVMALQVVDEQTPPAAAREPAPMTPPPSAPAQTPESASTPAQQFVTIIQPVTVKIRYGEAVLQPGTKLPLLSRDPTSVRVSYLGEIHVIPIAATDLK